MSIPAGPPATIEDYIEDRIDLGEYLTPKPDRTFLVRVEGESMVDAGIFPGDLLVVERGQDAHNGDVVVALTSNEFTVKRLRREGRKLWLVPANASLPDPAQVDFSVWGIVRYSIHKF